MYKTFFGLRENPFNGNPDPRYLFLTRQTQEALDEMTYGIQTRKGLILLTGEVGTGKTTLINRLLDWLHQQRTPTAFIFNSHLEASDLLDFILTDFRVPHDSGSQENRLMRLNHWLLERYRADEIPVLIVDEAQGVPIHVLEEIRMLLNLETPHEKLLQIVLAGQPELEGRLKRPDLRQLKQRIMLRCKTAALTPDETHDYIQARLHIAGANGKPIFTSEAMDAVHCYSGGIPRVVNLLCEHALVNAYVDDIQPVAANIIADVAREFEYDDIQSYTSPKVSADTLSARFSAFDLAPASTLVYERARAEELPCQEEHELSKAGASNPLPIMDTVLSDAMDTATPILNCEELPFVREGNETLICLDMPTREPIASEPGPAEVRKEEVLAALVPDANLQLVAEFEQERARLAFSSALRLVEANKKFEISSDSRHHHAPGSQKSARPPTIIAETKSNPPSWRCRTNASWKNYFLSRVTLQAWTQVTVSTIRHLNLSLHSLQSLYRRCLEWRHTCLAGSRREWSRMNSSVSHWLKEPWSPPHLRLPNFGTLRGRLSFSHKKAWFGGS